jgi:hypothetical protein
MLLYLCAGGAKKIYSNGLYWERFFWFTQTAYIGKDSSGKVGEIGEVERWKLSIKYACKG